MLERAVELVEERNLHPVVGKPYEWADAAQAFEDLRDGNFVGKIVIKV